mmetsp:Transcript_8220/g.30898  ORF Transcript_8220/g.30898 Transcript_8220/m.30898 type:complete len:523 (+) Transcript_8220:308-1876(+)
MIRAVSRIALQRGVRHAWPGRVARQSTAAGPLGLGAAGQCLAEAKLVMEQTKDDKAVDAVFEAALNREDLSEAQRAVVDLAHVKVIFGRENVSRADKLATQDRLASATDKLEGEGGLACLAARAEGLQILGRLKEIEADAADEPSAQALSPASEYLQTAGDVYRRALRDMQKTQERTKAVPNLLGTQNAADAALFAGAMHSYLEAGRIKVRYGDSINAAVCLREGLELANDPKSPKMSPSDKEVAEMMLGFCVLNLNDPTQTSEAIDAFSSAQASISKRVAAKGEAEDRSSLARCNYGLGRAYGLKAAMLQQEVQEEAQRLNEQGKGPGELPRAFSSKIAELRDLSEKAAVAFEDASKGHGMTDREIADAYQRAATGRAILQDFSAALANAEKAIALVEEILQDATDAAERKELNFALVNCLHMAGGFHADSDAAGGIEKGLEMCHRAYDLLIDADELEARVTQGQIRQAQGLMSAKLGKMKVAEGYFSEAYKIFSETLGEDEGLTQAAKSCMAMTKAAPEQ